MAFELLRSPTIHMAAQLLLSICAHGQVSRLVVNMGHRLTCTVPVFQGYHLPNATKSLDLKGTHLNTFLAEMLLGSGLPGAAGPGHCGEHQAPLLLCSP